MKRKKKIFYYYNSSQVSLIDENEDGQGAILVLGDSLAKGSNGDTGVGPTPTANTSFYYRSSNNTIAEIGAADLQFARNVPTNGSPWPKFCIDYNTKLSKKAVVVPCGFSSATITPNGNNNNWSASGDNYAIAVADANACMELLEVEKLKAIIIMLGINDSDDATDLQDVEDDARALINRLNTDFPNTDILWFQIGRNSTANNNVRINSIRKIIRDIAVDFDNVHLMGGYLAASPAGLVSGDNTHLSQTGQNEIGEIAARWFENSTYNKWARGVMSSCFYDDLSTLRKNLIAPLDNHLASLLEQETTLLFKNTIQNNIWADWTYSVIPANTASIGFSANQHISSNGTASHMRHAFVPSFAQIATQTDIFEAIKIKTVTTAAGTAGSAFGGNNTGRTVSCLLRQTTGSTVQYEMNDASLTTYTGDTKLQNDTEYVVARSGGDIYLYKNGVQVHTASVASTGLSAISQNLGANNNDGTANSFLNATYEWFRAGRQTGVDHAAFYDFMENIIDHWND